MILLETIAISDTTRVLVVADEDASCPRGDWSMLTGFVTTQSTWKRLDVPPVHSDPTGRMMEAHDSLDDSDTVVRWARIFHNLTVEWDREHGGYWFVDPASYEENWPNGEWLHEYTSPRRGAKTWATKADWERSIIDGEREMYRQWCDGEAFGLILEERSGWAKLNPDGGLVFTNNDIVQIDRWEETDACYGFYLDEDSDDTYELSARSHFGLPNLVAVGSIAPTAPTATSAAPTAS